MPCNSPRRCVPGMMRSLRSRRSSSPTSIPISGNTRSPRASRFRSRSNRRGSSPRRMPRASARARPASWRSNPASKASGTTTRMRPPWSRCRAGPGRGFGRSARHGWRSCCWVCRRWRTAPCLPGTCKGSRSASSAGARSRRTGAGETPSERLPLRGGASRKRPRPCWPRCATISEPGLRGAPAARWRGRIPTSMLVWLRGSAGATETVMPSMKIR